MELENHCHICKNKSQHTLCKSCYVPLFVPIEKHVSFAFLTDIPEEVDNESLKDTIVLDFFKSNLVNAEISNFSQLRQLRLSHCAQLQTINLTNLPNLISLDAFDCKEVTEATFTNLPNLIALDLSFCTELTSIQGDFPKVEYFSISHTQIANLPSLPSVKYVDITSTKISDISSLYDCQNLQRLNILMNTSIKSIEVEKLVRIPSFTTLISKFKLMDFKGIPQNQIKENIYKFNAYQLYDNIRLAGHAAYVSKQPCFDFDEPIFSGDWFESYRYLYGPYPTPPNDSKQTLTDEELQSITNIFPLPSNVDANVAAYHIMGSIFGTAVGDCLGIFCEGRDSQYINAFIDHPFEITWTHPITSLRGSFFHRGSFTDDTALMLVFIRSVVSTALKNITKSPENVAGNVFDQVDSGNRIYHWIKHGIDEHLDNSGIGRGGYTEDVVNQPKYNEKPIEVSRQFWIDTGKVKNGSGGVMRTGACGCFLFWDEKKVIENAKLFCQCTHYHPECVFSSTLISLIISRLLQLRCGLRKTFELDSTIEEVKEMFQAKKGEENIDKISDFYIIDKFLYAEEIDDLDLFDRKTKTLTTMGCGIWALRMNFTYEKGIEEIIKAGGDTDTNAACAGAVLGAKWGFGDIPLHLLDYLWYGGILYRDTIPFLSTMGMKFDPPTYEEIKKFKY